MPCSEHIARQPRPSSALAKDRHRAGGEVLKSRFQFFERNVERFGNVPRRKLARGANVH